MHTYVDICLIYEFYIILHVYYLKFSGMRLSGQVSSREITSQPVLDAHTIFIIFFKYVINEWLPNSFQIDNTTKEYDIISEIF